MQRFATRIVVLSNGAAGAEKQALALGARLQSQLPPASDVHCVRATPTRLAHALPPAAHLAAAVLAGDPLFGYELSAQQRRLLLHQDDTGVKETAQRRRRRRPLDVVVGCGRTTVALCAALKRAAPHDVFAVQIQHPRVPLAWFDAVVAPRHDFSARTLSVRPPGLHLTTGTVHDVSREQLVRAADCWRERLGDFAARGRVCVAWLVGGPCRGFAFSSEDARAIAAQFVSVVHSAAVAGDSEPAVFVTFSRRTPAQVVAIIDCELRASFVGDRQLFVWSGAGENPYHAFLALATVVVTTPDSISMTTEAVASAKPVFTVGVERAQGKFRRFHEALFGAEFSAPLTAAGVSLALATKATARNGARRPAPHEALEQELSAIASTLAQQIVSACEKQPN